VVALFYLVEVDEVGVGLLGIGPRGPVELVREDADGRRDRDALEVEEAELVLPEEAGRETPSASGTASRSRTGQVRSASDIPGRYPGRCPGQLSRAAQRNQRE